MNWSVTYRAKDGRQSVVVFEAESREALFKVLADKGITAIRIEQGMHKRPQTRARWVNRKVARGVVAGVAVVGLALGILYFLMCGTGDKQGKADQPRKQSRIAAVTPAPVAPKPAEVEVEPLKVDPNARPTKAFEKVNGYVMLPSGRMHKLSKNVLTNDFNVTQPKPKYAVFEHHVENQIASLLTLPPGGTLVGTPKYDQKFVDAFLKSLENPIIVSKDDDEAAAELKRAMIETKKDLKARYDAGEDIAQIMNETHNEFQKLSRVKKDIEEEVRKIQRDPNATIDDIDDFVSAANILLEQKGIEPIQMNPIVRQMLILQRENNR